MYVPVVKDVILSVIITCVIPWIMPTTETVHLNKVGRSHPQPGLSVRTRTKAVFSLGDGGMMGKLDLVRGDLLLNLYRHLDLLALFNQLSFYLTSSF